jgi:competence protein ComGC
MNDSWKLSKKFNLGSGLIILLLLASVILPQIDNQWIKLQKTKVKYQSAKVSHINKQAELNDLKKELRQINSEVNREADQISLLIYEAGTFTDSIKRLIDQPITASDFTDSLKFLQERLTENEREVDSLNALFESKSTNLLDLMKSYTKSEQKLEQSEIQLTGLKNSLSGKKLFLKIEIILSLFLLIIGLILLFSGFLKKQGEMQKNFIENKIEKDDLNS